MSGATSVQPLPGEGPPTGGDTTAVGLGPPGVTDGAGDAAAGATGVGVAAGGTPRGSDIGWLRPPGAKRVALVGLGVATAVAAVEGEGLAVAEGVTAGEGDLEPFAPALRRPVSNVLLGVAAGVTPAVAAGVAAAVTAGVVTGASVRDGVAPGGAGVIGEGGQRPQVTAQKPSYTPSSAQAVQLPNAFYRKTHSVTAVFRKHPLQQACKIEIHCKSYTNSG